MIVEIAVILPMLFFCCSASIHSVQLPKIMYLCPMNMEERRKYVYGSYYFRAGVHMLIAILGLCVIVSNSHCGTFSAIQILLNDLLVAGLVDREWHADGRRRGMVVGEIIFVIALLSNAVQYSIIVFVNQNLRFKIVLFCFFVLVQLPLEIWYLKYVRGALRAAVSYEADWGQKGQCR